ncbi:hypothetical protein [Kordiimonas sp.]
MQIQAPAFDVDPGETIKKVTEQFKELAQVVANVKAGYSGPGDLKATSDIGGFLQALVGDIGGEVGGLLGKVFPGSGGEKQAGEEGGSLTAGTEADTSKIDEAQGKTTDDAIKGEEDREKANAKAWAGIVGNAVKSSKVLSKIRKAFAIGEVVKDTAMAISKAVASAPFPLNVPAIAFAAATGAAQLAAVKGQAHDGLDKVPSTGTYLLEKGERVVDKRLNADLSNFLNVQGGGGGLTSVTNQTHAPVISPNINLTLNGDVQPDAVHGNRGALESMIRGIFADYAMEAPFGR